MKTPTYTKLNGQPMSQCERIAYDAQLCRINEPHKAYHLLHSAADASESDGDADAWHYRYAANQVRYGYRWPDGVTVQTPRYLC